MTTRTNLADVTAEDESFGNANELAERFTTLLDLALSHAGFDKPPACVSVLVADNDTICELNHRFRGIEKPTNVLSFPATKGMTSDGGEAFLGDIALATGVIRQEAADQGKALETHLCHLVIHGILHLLGFDHETDQDAEHMEQLETEIMRSLGLPDPYDDLLPDGKGHPS